MTDENQPTHQRKTLRATCIEVSNFSFFRLNFSGLLLLVLSFSVQLLCCASMASMNDGATYLFNSMEISLGLHSVTSESEKEMKKNSATLTPTPYTTEHREAATFTKKQTGSAENKTKTKNHLYARTFYTFFFLTHSLSLSFRALGFC